MGRKTISDIPLLESPGLPLVEGQHVRLTIETEDVPVDVLGLAEQVYNGLSDEEIDAIERIALDCISLTPTNSLATIGLTHDRMLRQAIESLISTS